MLIQTAPLCYLDLVFFGTSLKLNRGDIFSSPRLLWKMTPNILCACASEPFVWEIGMSPASLVRGIILELHNSTSPCVLPLLLWTPSHSLTELPHSSTLTFPNCTHLRKQCHLYLVEMEHDVVWTQIVVQHIMFVHYIHNAY